MSIRRIKKSVVKELAVKCIKNLIPFFLKILIYVGMELVKDLSILIDIFI